MENNENSFNYNNGTIVTDNQFSSDGREKFEYYDTMRNDVNDYENSEEKINDEFIIKACIEGNLNIIQEFVDSQCVNKTLITGWTLLLYAASSAQLNIIQYLLSIGADPNSHQEGYTPLMALSNSNKGSQIQRMECLKYLIEWKANVNAANKLRETALMYACKIQEIDFIIELLKYVDNINFADSEQKTALFYAVIENRYEITKTLIEHGSDITWINLRGLNPYDVAVSKEYQDLIPLLTIDCHEDKQENINIRCINSWLDMFSTISEIDMNSVDNDVACMLYGMGLDGYKACFRGLDLKTFLRLREEDLKKLEVDISVHRKKFVDGLLKFHKHEWSNNLMINKNIQQFTPFDAIKILGNINKQLSVITSSIYFSKNILDSIEIDKKLNISNKEIERLQTEMNNIKVTALRIQNATNKIRSLTEIIKEQNSDLCLPTFIEKKKKNNSNKWIAIIVMTITSFYFFKIRNIKRLWSN